MSSKAQLIGKKKRKLAEEVKATISEPEQNEEEHSSRKAEKKTKKAVATV